MSVRFYMDEHVSRAVTIGLRRQGVDVITVQEDDRAGASDPEVLERATELDRVLFTQDDDLLVEANRRQNEGTNFSGVVYAHQLRATIGDLVGDLVLLAKAAELEELTSTVLYLPL